MSPKEAATLTAGKISLKRTFWLVLSTTPLLASLKGSRASRLSEASQDRSRNKKHTNGNHAVSFESKLMAMINLVERRLTDMVP